MVSIIPAILETTPAGFEAKLKKLFGLVDAVQVDVIDGVFAPEKTVFPEELKEIETAIKFDYQLMVDEPVGWLNRCQTPQARAVYGHIEKMSDPAEFIGKAQFIGFKVGLALDLDTPVERIKEYVWDLDGLILMSVPAGRGGQTFDEKVLKKIEHARALRDDLPLVIDGGLDVPQIKRCISAEWAQELAEDELHRNFLDISFAVGNHLFTAPDVKQKLEDLENLRQ